VGVLPQARRLGRLGEGPATGALVGAAIGSVSDSLLKER